MVSLAIMIPTLNRWDLLRESLETLLPQDSHFERLFIIDNGNQGIVIDHPKLTVFHSNRNLGVAASWNLALSNLFNYSEVTHVLSLNDDVVLGEDQLPKIIEFLENNPDYWIYSSSFHMAVYVISREGYANMLNQWGYVFDPCFWPAYCEDNDIHYRLNLMDDKKWRGGITEMHPKLARNSMTSKKDGVINHERSLMYYKQKWGGGPKEETFLTPFNR